MLDVVLAPVNVSKVSKDEHHGKNSKSRRL